MRSQTVILVLFGLALAATQFLMAVGVALWSIPGVIPILAASILAYLFFRAPERKPDTTGA